MVSYSSVKGRKNHSERELIEYKLSRILVFQGIVISDYEGVEYLDGNSLYKKVSKMQ
jgi:beta-glucosidase